MPYSGQPFTEHDGGEHQTSGDEPLAGELGQRTPERLWCWHQQSCGEDPRNVGFNDGIGEVQPTPAQGGPHLVDGLLGAEHEPIPVNGWGCSGEVFEEPLLLCSHHRRDGVGGQWGVRFCVDADGHGVSRDRSRPVAGAVGDRAHDSRWPPGGAALGDGDQHRGQAEVGQGSAGAAACCGELGDSLLHSSGDGRPLLGEQPTVGWIGKGFRGGDLGRQDPLDHTDLTALTRSRDLLSILRMRVVLVCCRK